MTGYCPNCGFGDIHFPVVGRVIDYMVVDYISRGPKHPIHIANGLGMTLPMVNESLTRILSRNLIVLLDDGTYALPPGGSA